MPSRPNDLDFIIPSRPIRGEYPPVSTHCCRPMRNARRRRRCSWRPLRILSVMMFTAALAFGAGSPDVRSAAAAAWPGSSPMDVFGQNHVRILLLGADQQYDARGERLKQPGRSDTLILADLDLEHQRAHLCSIPRDTQTRIPGYGRRRINCAYALGGPELAAETVGNLTGRPVDYTVAVNLEAFRRAVDAVGGVEVTIDKPMQYKDNWGGLTIDLPAGRQVLDGEHAMQFVRFRSDAMADIGRTRRQQAFLKAFGDTLKKPTSVVLWPNVVRSVADHTDTTLTPAQMIALGRFVRGLRSDAISSETLPGRFSGPRWQPDEEGIRRMMARIDP